MKKIVIIGFGEAGKELKSHLGKTHQIVEIFDDRIKGCKRIATLESFLKENSDVKDAYYCIPSGEPSLLKGVAKTCLKFGVSLKVVPRVTEIIEGKLDISQVKTLKYDDVIGRGISKKYNPILRKPIAGKVCLVTGAAGSIGSEICTQLLYLKPKKIICMDAAETPLFYLKNKLESINFEKVNLSFRLIDVRNNSALSGLFSESKIDIVFHAAAYKHVPLLQDNIQAAFDNNCIGTYNLLNQIRKYENISFIFISTDKAVDPVSVMGYTKRICELLTFKYAAEDKKNLYNVVRFGNVIGSNGSVIQLFREQIYLQKKVLITDPRMERFFMSIEEAVQLVLLAIADGGTNQLYVLDMGKPVKIIDVAKEMILFEGFSQEEIKIEIIGLRPGEKLSESLWYGFETQEKTKFEKIKKAKYVSLRSKYDNIVDGLLAAQSEEQILSLTKIAEAPDGHIKFSPPSVGVDELDAISRTFRTGWLTIGPTTRQFEQKFNEYIGCKHSVFMNSCTSALFIALKLINIQEGDEVLTSPLTFVSAVNVIEHINAKPVFVDIDKRSFNIDPNEIEKHITKKTKAIIVTHYAGYAADIEKITRIAKKHNLNVIEDCAHSMGSHYLNGKKVGTSGNLCAFSFYATKNLTTGEGGLLTVRNQEEEDVVRQMILHGMSRDAWKRYHKEGTWRYDVLFPGYKVNSTDINAAIGMAQLGKIDELNLMRRQIAERYDAAFARSKDVKVRKLENRQNCNFHLYPIVVDEKKRDGLISYLKKMNIDASVHFIPVYEFTYYKNKYKIQPNKYPNNDEISKGLVSIPLHPFLSQTNQNRIIAEVNNFFRSNEKAK